MINLLFYALTITYFAARTRVITELFPTAIYYASLALLVICNLVLVFELVLTCLETTSTRPRCTACPDPCRRRRRSIW